MMLRYLFFIIIISGSYMSTYYCHAFLLQQPKNSTKAVNSGKSSKHLPAPVPTASPPLRSNNSNKKRPSNPTTTPAIAPTPPLLPHRCGIHTFNDHNVGHIFADVLPSILDKLKNPAQEICTIVVPNHAALKTLLTNSVLFQIGKQLHLPLRAQTKKDFEAGGIEGKDFYYQRMLGRFRHGFQRMRQYVQRHIVENCKCPEYPTAAPVAQCNNQTITKITIFNREARHYANYLELLSKLEGLSSSSPSAIGRIEWEYFDRTSHSDQCWHFCKYRNTSIALVPYGAEAIYPIITNRSAIVMGYHGREDVFVERVIGSYGFHGGDLVVLNTSRTLEPYNKDCYERWMHPPAEHENYLFHKCMSYYMDHHFIEQVMETIHEFRTRECERIQYNTPINITIN